MSSRTALRNIHIYAVQNPGVLLGGLILTHGMTHADLYTMIDIVFVFNYGYIIRDESGIWLQKDPVPLQAGKYYILTAGTITETAEGFLPRERSLSGSKHTYAFRIAVRGRDRRCVVTGKGARGAEFGYWDGLEAAHVFPLAYERHWIDHDYGKHITMHPASGGSINSVQNGILLYGGIHKLFDSYGWSINPNDNYKIVCFVPDDHGIAGTYLDRRFLDDPRRPPDQLLQWHFKQAVLANMKGHGEQVIGLTFPFDTDTAAETMSTLTLERGMQLGYAVA